MKLSTHYGDRLAEEFQMLFQRILQNATHDLQRRYKVRSLRATLPAINTGSWAIFRSRNAKHRSNNGYTTAICLLRRKSFGRERGQMVPRPTMAQPRKMKNPRKVSSTQSPVSSGKLLVELAGFRRRIASLVYESLLLAGILALTFLVPNLILGVLWGVTPPGWFMWIHVFVVLGAYFVWYWTRNGQTLAMQTWRLQIVTVEEGKPPAALTGWLRYLLAWPSVSLGGLGLLWALVDRDRQFLHDRLAGTRVVLLPDPKAG